MSRLGLDSFRECLESSWFGRGISILWERVDLVEGGTARGWSTSLSLKDLCLVLCCSASVSWGADCPCRRCSRRTPVSRSFDLEDLSFVLFFFELSEDSTTSQCSPPAVMVSFAGRTFPEAVRISLNVSVCLLVTGVEPLCDSSLTSISAFDLVASIFGFEASAFGGEGLRDGRSETGAIARRDAFVGTTGVGAIGTVGLCGVGGFTIIEALDRGESSMKDKGDDATVARAEVEMDDKGL